MVLIGGVPSVGVAVVGWEVVVTVGIGVGWGW